jgi:hypothetical protein
MAGEIAVRAEDLQSMLTAMEADDTVRWCEICGAWLAYDDEALATTEYFTGCWKAATGDSRYDHLCRSWRGTMIDEVRQRLNGPISDATAP